MSYSNPEGTKVKEFNGVDIYVNAEGQFNAQIGGDLVKRASLRDIEKLIVKQGQPVRCFSSRGYGGAVDEYKFIGAETHDRQVRYRDENRRLLRAYDNSDLYLWDDKIVKALAEIESRRADVNKELDKQRKAVLRRATSLTPAILKAEQAKLAQKAPAKKGAAKKR